MNRTVVCLIIVYIVFMTGLYWVAFHQPAEVAEALKRAPLNTVISLESLLEVQS